MILYVVSDLSFETLLFLVHQIVLLLNLIWTQLAILMFQHRKQRMIEDETVQFDMDIQSVFAGILSFLNLNMAKLRNHDL